MVVSSIFASPLGLAAVAAAVPLIALYLIQPDPRHMELPTMQFLVEDTDDSGANPIVDRLRRNILLLLQLLVIVLLAISLASPYVTTTQAVSAESTVIVVDAGASMAVETDSGTRFESAISRAQSAVGTPTHIVVAGATTHVPSDGVSPAAARATLSELSVTDAPGDLRSAISRAASIASPDSRLVVVSDFTEDSDWQAAVQTARANGIDVSLEQVGDGGTDNVGIVARQFDNRRVTLSVKNTGSTTATRTLSFAGQSRQLSLQPGDVATRSFPLPNESSRAVVTPRDSFPTDDVAYVTLPQDQTVEALLVTNSDNQTIQTALSVVPTVELTVSEPPAPISTEYDIVVFGGVDRSALLQSTLSTTRDIVNESGGIAIQTQADVDRVGFGDLLPIRPKGVRNTSAVADVTQHRLTRGIRFPTPDRHLEAARTRGSTLVETEDGSPLLVTARQGDGRVLYYGYLPNQTSFRYSYQYPVFWQRVAHWLADRPPLTELNRKTGDTLELANQTSVQSPTGTRQAVSVQLDTVGTYRTGNRRASASLLSATETNVTAPTLDTATAGTETAVKNDTATAGYRVRQDLTPISLLLVLLVVLLELGYLRRRGDV